MIRKSMFKISLRVIFLISAISLMLNVKTAVSNGEKINKENEDYNFSNIECKELKKDEIELVFQGRGGVSFNIKLEMDKKLKKGIDLLNRGKYEDAARFFESFLLTNPQIFDQLVAANIGSFNSLALKSGEGAGYFEKKVEAHPEDYLSAYYFGIFKIIGLSTDKESSEYLEKVPTHKINFNKLHYMLGLGYLLQGGEDLYLKEYNLLAKKSTKFAKRLKIAYSSSQAIQIFLKDNVIEVSK
jgi:tetratricopeptide (TPR) repeat protein